MNPFRVDIIGLPTKVHHFEYKLSGDFFEEYGTELVKNGEFDVRVVLDKHETFIETDFSISGTVQLVCDRSLEPFDYPINIRKKVLFKYGDESMEISDDIIMITRDQAGIDLGQLIYEFIAVEIPMKKLHPRYSGNESGNEGQIVYSSASDDPEKTVDPRWEALKKLK